MTKTSMGARWAWQTRSSLVSLFLVVFTVLAASGSLVPAKAYAGDNGQQVQVVANTGMSTVSVTGTNQSGAKVTWSGTPAGDDAITTWDWWWVGEVVIDVTFTNGTSRRCYNLVLQEDDEDVDTGRCDFVGGWNGLQLRVKSGVSLGYSSVVVTGKNQDGNTATWSESPNGATEVETWDWWWIGPVTINVGFTDGSAAVCTADVPQVYVSQVFVVQCGPSGGGTIEPFPGGGAPPVIKDPTVNSPNVTATLKGYPEVELRFRFAFDRLPGIPGSTDGVSLWFVWSDNGVSDEGVPALVNSTTGEITIKTVAGHYIAFAIEVKNTSRNRRGSYPAGFVNDPDTRRTLTTRYRLGDSPNDDPTYWNKWDVDITNAALGKNIPPAVMKAIMAQETYGFNTTDNRSGDPSRSYLYEAWWDYLRGISSYKDENGYERGGYGRPWTKRWELPDNLPPSQPCDGQVPNLSGGTTIWNLWDTYTACTNRSDYRDPEHPVLHKPPANAIAQYRLMASYGLAQFYYPAEHCRLGGCPTPIYDPATYDPSQAAPPETFYEPSLSIALMAAKINSDRNSFDSTKNLGRDSTDIGAWKEAVQAYNGKPRADYVTGVSQWYTKVQPKIDVIWDPAAQAASAKASPSALAVVTNARSLSLPSASADAVGVIDQRIADLTGQNIPQLLSLEYEAGPDGDTLAVGRIYAGVSSASAVQFQTPATSGAYGLGSVDIVQTTALSEPLILLNVPTSPHAFVTRIFVIKDAALQELLPDATDTVTPYFFNEHGPAIVQADGSVLSTVHASFPQRNVGYVYRYEQGGFALAEKFVKAEEQATYPDTSPPTTLVKVSGTVGKNNWYTTPVVVTLAASDEGSGVSQTLYRFNGGAWQQYGGPFTIDAEGATALEVYSTDLAGNTEAVKRKRVSIDTRRPIVQAWTDKPEYTRVEPFVVHYSGDDPMPGSGLDTLTATLDVQPVSSNQVVDLFWYSLGGHTVIVTGTDRAGWQTVGTAPFALIATLGSLRPTVERLRQLGEIDNAGTATSLLTKIDGAVAAYQRGQRKPAINKLEALLQEIRAQSGKHISVRGSALLAGDVQYVIEHLP
jgi:hypothetical protein